MSLFPALLSASSRRRGGGGGSVSEVSYISGATLDFLEGAYFLLGADVYVWFSVDGSGANPSVGGRRGIQVAIGDNNPNATQIAGSIAVAVDADADFTAEDNFEGTCTITRVAPGPVPDIAIGTMGPTGAVVGTLTQGS